MRVHRATGPRNRASTREGSPDAPRHCRRLVTVFYSCPSPHDLYIGTSLYSDRGVAGVSLDEDAETELDCLLDAEPAVVTRRKVRSAVPAGSTPSPSGSEVGGLLLLRFSRGRRAVGHPGPLCR